MNSRDRQLAAIRHECPDRIPVDAIAVENLAQIAELLGVAVDGVADRLGLDGRIVAPDYTGERRTLPDGTVLGPFGTIETGDYGSASWHPFGADTGIGEVERHCWPDADQWDYQTAGASASRLAERYAVRGPYWYPIFSCVCSLFGIEDALIKLALEPAVFQAAAERVTEIVCGVCERLLDECGASMPVLCLGDDFATQRGLMISPDQWRKHVRPYVARVFDLAKRRGRYVWFHSCGDVSAVLPDLIDIGMDVWETVQLHTLPVSAQELKREYGRHITFFGGVNTQRLPFASPELVRDEVVRCIIFLGEGGGYICGPDHHVKPDVPAANALALFDAATGFRRAGYTAGLEATGESW